LIGFIDMSDVLWFILWSIGWRKTETETGSGGKSSQTRENFTEFLILERFRNATCIDVLGRPRFGTRNQAHHVFKGFSLFHVVETMARISSHRVAICSTEKKVIGIVTQSMVISLFDQYLDRLGTLATGHTVSEMIPGLFEELKLVQDTDLTLNAFNCIVNQNVSGLAVVDHTGALVDTISARDLRGIGATGEDWSALWLNVKEFKELVRKKYPSQTPTTPIYVQDTDSLEVVIKRMKDGNIHRVFVCQVNEGKPVPSFCISQRDVLRFLIHLCGLESTPL